MELLSTENIDIACWAEAKGDKALLPAGWQRVDVRRPGARGNHGGGASIWISPRATMIKHSPSDATMTADQAEYCWVEVAVTMSQRQRRQQQNPHQQMQTRRTNLIIVSLYLQPRGEGDISNLTADLLRWSSSGKHVVLMGDFNCDINKQNSTRALQLRQAAAHAGLSVHRPSAPTFINNRGSTSVIDYMMCSHGLSRCMQPDHRHNNDGATIDWPYQHVRGLTVKPGLSANGHQMMVLRLRLSAGRQPTSVTRFDLDLVRGWLELEKKDNLPLDISRIANELSNAARSDPALPSLEQLHEHATTQGISLQAVMSLWAQQAISLLEELPRRALSWMHKHAGPARVVTPGQAARHRYAAQSRWWSRDLSQMKRRRNQLRRTAHRQNKHMARLRRTRAAIMDLRSQLRHGQHNAKRWQAAGSWPPDQHEINMLPGPLAAHERQRSLDPQLLRVITESIPADQWYVELQQQDQEEPVEAAVEHLLSWQLAWCGWWHWWAAENDEAAEQLRQCKEHIMACKQERDTTSAELHQAQARLSSCMLKAKRHHWRLTLGLINGEQAPSPEDDDAEDDHRASMGPTATLWAINRGLKAKHGFPGASTGSSANPLDAFEDQTVVWERWRRLWQRPPFEGAGDGAVPQPLPPIDPEQLTAMSNQQRRRARRTQEAARAEQQRVIDQYEVERNRRAEASMERVAHIVETWIATADPWGMPPTQAACDRPNPVTGTADMQTVGRAHDYLCRPISSREIKQAASSLAWRKAAGPHAVPYEVWQFLLRNAALPQLASCFNLLLADEDGPLPEGWSLSLVHLLHKGGELSRAEPGNYRPIALLSTLRKTLERVIHDRLQAWHRREGCMSELLHWSQHGFREARGCNDAHLVLRAARSAAKRAGVKMGVVFLDLKKAYDSVNHVLLVEELTRAGLPPRLIQVLWKLMTGIHMDLQWGCHPGQHELESRQPIQATRGLPQGSILSPLLFNIFINGLLADEQLHEHGVVIGGKRMGCSFFADDGLLLATGRTWAQVQQRLQLQLNVCWTWSRSHDLQWSPKTKAMMMKQRGPMPRARLSLGPNMKIDWVRRFTYLGVDIVAARDQCIIPGDSKHVQGAAALIKTHQCLLSTRQGMSVAKALTVYKVVIRSKMAYGLANYGASDTMDKVQHAALRMILCTYRRTHRWQLQEELCMLTMSRYGGKIAVRAFIRACTSLYPWIRSVAAECWLHRTQDGSLGHLIAATLRSTGDGGQALLARADRPHRTSTARPWNTTCPP